jgi:hypothetical protein
MMAHPVGETTPEPEHPRPGAALGGPGASTNTRQGDLRTDPRRGSHWRLTALWSAAGAGSPGGRAARCVVAHIINCCGN